jgi:Tfp pilus assembly protein PilN
MASINLIAARRAEHHRLMRVTRALGIACITAVSCLLGIFTLNSARLIHTNIAMGQLDAELIRLKPTLERIRVAQMERQELQPKLVTLTNAQSATLRWFDVLDGLKKTVPQQAWLTSLTVEGSKDGEQAVKFNGITVSQKLVGETMLRLNQFSYYKGVDLHYTQTGKLGKRDTVEFEVAAQLKPLEGQKYETAPTQAQ